MKFWGFLRNFSGATADLACACGVAATAQTKGPVPASTKHSAFIEISGNFDLPNP
jgi:hypothetical protein